MRALEAPRALPRQTVSQRTGPRVGPHATDPSPTAARKPRDEDGAGPRVDCYRDTGTSHRSRPSSSSTAGKLTAGELRIIAADVGGSRDAIARLCSQPAETLLLQERKRGQQQIHGQVKKRFAMGWHGVWAPAA